MRRASGHSVLFWVAVSLAPASISAAHIDTNSTVGTSFDFPGAPIPGSESTFSNLGTKVPRFTMTVEIGGCAVLLPGRCSAAARKPGFQLSKVPNVKLDVDQESSRGRSCRVACTLTVQNVLTDIGGLNECEF